MAAHDCHHCSEKPEAIWSKRRLPEGDDTTAEASTDTHAVVPRRSCQTCQKALTFIQVLNRTPQVEILNPQQSPVQQAF